MDRLAVELLEHIFLLACHDGGSTGCSLSLVSKRIRVISRAARFYTVALLSSNPDKVAQFSASLIQERAKARTATPRVRHLYLTSAVRRATPHLPGISSLQMADALQRNPYLLMGLEEPARQLRAEMKREVEEYHMDIAALLRLVAPDLHTLTLVHCHRAGRLEMRFPEAIECTSFPLLRELTIVGSQPKITSANDSVPLPRLTKLHLAVVSLSAYQALDILRWADDAPQLSHLRISNINYWPRSLPESLKKAFNSKRMYRRLKQVILQPHPAPPLDGPCIAPHFVYSSFMKDLCSMCKPSEIPALLLLHNKEMKEHSWEDAMRRAWLDRIDGGLGCWDTGDPRAEAC